MIQQSCWHQQRADQCYESAKILPIRRLHATPTSGVLSLKSNLVKRGFLSLVVTQFFGAANDNLLKGVLAFAVALGGIWQNALGEGGQAYVSLCLTVPFILFSGIAGQIADMRSKRSVTVAVKIAEVFIAAIALIGFLNGNLWVTLGCMLLLAIQSTFFGPAKYGMIPELVPAHDLSRANGVINMMTNIAVIAGTLLAGPLYEAYYPQSNPTFATATNPPAQILWAPGTALIVIALLGLTASLFIPRLQPRSPKLKFDFNPFGTYIASIRDMAKTQLLLVALAWSFFYMVGMMALLILPDYKTLLNVNAIEASYLLGVLGVSIGLGSVAAGLLSGHHIEPRLIPVGAVGMTVGFLLLGWLPLNYWLVAGLLFGSGFFAGFYIIPLQSLLQFLSPIDERGRFLGTANALSFVASTIGTLIFLMSRRTFNLDANRIFLFCASLSVVGTGLMIWKMRGLITNASLRKQSADDVESDATP